jgi:hypothetical protein
MSELDQLIKKGRLDVFMVSDPLDEGEGYTFLYAALDREDAELRVKLDINETFKVGPLVGITQDLFHCRREVLKAGRDGRGVVEDFEVFFHSREDQKYKEEWLASLEETVTLRETALAGLKAAYPKGDHREFEEAIDKAKEEVQDFDKKWEEYIRVRRRKATMVRPGHQMYYEMIALCDRISAYDSRCPANCGCNKCLAE